jgi:hypothetical protein
MRRLLTALVAACAFALGASPVLGAGAIHMTEDVTGDVIVCGANTYTVTSGTLRIVLHEGFSASGNINFTGTLTPQHIVAEDGAGNVYSLVGAFWFGATANANTGGAQSTFTGKLQIVSNGGGTVDSVNVVMHISPNGHVSSFDFGTCVAPM